MSYNEVDRLEPLQWRAITQDDLPALAALDEACLRTDGPASVGRPGYGQLLVNPAITTICAAEPTRGEIAAIGWVRPAVEKTWLHGKVHPAFRRMGFGAQLLRRTEQIASKLPEPGVPSIVNEALNEGSEALYAQEGYTRDFIELWMQRDLSEPIPAIDPPLPFQRWSEETMDGFFDAYREAFRERMNPDLPPPVKEEWLEEHEGDSDFRPDLSLLARYEGTPVGFLTAYLFRIDDVGQTVGWISQVGTHPSWRERGLAASMIAATMQAFRREGLAWMGLHVNVNNPGAIRVYEQLGFAAIGRRGKYHKRLPAES